MVKSRLLDLTRQPPSKLLGAHCLRALHNTSSAVLRRLNLRLRTQSLVTSRTTICQSYEAARTSSMAPLVEAFPPWQLEARVQRLPDGRRRKQPVDLRDCKLMEMVQYSCHLNGPQQDPRSVVICEPIVRLFRRYNLNPIRYMKITTDVTQMRRRFDGRDDHVGRWLDSVYDA